MSPLAHVCLDQAITGRDDRNWGRSDDALGSRTQEMHATLGSYLAPIRRCRDSGTNRALTRRGTAAWKVPYQWERVSPATCKTLGGKGGRTFTSKQAGAASKQVSAAVQLLGAQGPAIRTSKSPLPSLHRKPCGGCNSPIQVVTTSLASIPWIRNTNAPDLLLARQTGRLLFFLAPDIIGRTLGKGNIRLSPPFPFCNVVL